MLEKKEERKLTLELITQYENYLLEQERSSATILKYIHGLKEAMVFFEGNELVKQDIIRWKKQLAERYSVSSVNGALAALNGCFNFCGWEELKVRPLKRQREIFCPEDKELTQKEYVRLVHTAQKQGNLRLSLVIQTICSTGIRVSELKYITAESVATGRAIVFSKVKQRKVFLPKRLCILLKMYLKQQQRTKGPVFVTKNDRPLNRSNIWREMKALCDTADVSPEKVFPHNLCHLFARIYYTLEKDLSRLADLLGHTSVDTTRIYTAESGAVHARQMERMGLVVT